MIYLASAIQLVNGDTSCSYECPQEDDVACGLDIKSRQYKMFPGKCALQAYSKCHQVEYEETPLKFCIQNHMSRTRRIFGDSCPVFCPQHYSPVCAASNIRSYAYRTFNNGCFLDMINCRGEEDSGYTEVPLQYCQRHAMKNIFKEQVVITNMRPFLDVF
ncbi:hypothetical protein ABMA28_005087 [Loxostege sticticalis]|uniref:Uncharacterized protein n=1 Tax=Loxostege sticticalis TaxID=481309 RepID=A0ABD0SPU4_LOXSC